MVMHTITGIARRFWGLTLIRKNIRRARFAMICMVMRRFTVRHCRRMERSGNKCETENQTGEQKLHAPCLATSAIFGKHFICPSSDNLRLFAV